MLQQSQLVPDILTTVEAGDFENPRHERIFEAITNCWQQKSEIDALIVSEQLSKTGHLSAIGGAPYLFDLLQNAPLGSTAIEHAKQVREAGTKRKLFQAGVKIQQLAESSNDLDFVLESAQNALNETAVKETTTITGVKDGLDDLLDEIGRMADGGEIERGVETGFWELDDKTNGFQGGQMIIVAARPGVGKSTLAVDFMRHASIRNQQPTLLFSLEMSKKEVQQRMISAEAEVHTQAVKKGTLTDAEWARIKTARDNMIQSPIFIDDSPNLTMIDIAAKTKLMVKKHGIKLMVVDYLQLVTGGGSRESRQQEVSDISRQLKLLAKSCDIPVIAIAQLNRGVESRGEGAVPKPSDLRESGSLEQDADIILLIHRPDVNDPEHARAGEADVIIGKHRGGPLGTCTVASQMHYSRFVDFPK